MNILEKLQQALSGEKSHTPPRPQLSSAVVAQNTRPLVNEYNKQGQPTYIVFPNTDWQGLADSYKPPALPPLAPLGQLKSTMPRKLQGSAPRDLQRTGRLQVRTYRPELQQQAPYNQQQLQPGVTYNSLPHLLSQLPTRRLQ